jgi:hypothetical protein
MKINGYDEFGFRDLAAPNPRKFKRQLSVLINYMKFKQDNAYLLDNLMEGVS